MTVTKEQRRYVPHVDVTHWSPNKSSRGGASATLIVIHATAGHNRPGVVDLVSLGAWFGSTASQVSSHVATDNEGNSARFVRDYDKAWHCAGYNRLALGIEQVLPGDGTEITPNSYRETARWVARWSHIHGIPVRHGAVSNGRVIRSGVVTHQELGTIGGGHSDPGPGYNMQHLVSLSKFYKKKAYA